MPLNQILLSFPGQSGVDQGTDPGSESNTLITVHPPVYAQWYARPGIFLSHLKKAVERPWVAVKLPASFVAFVGHGIAVSENAGKCLSSGSTHGGMS